MAVFSFVVSDLYGGGAQRVLLNTADALRQRGHQVTVYLLRDKIEHDVPQGLKLVNLRAINRVTKLFRTVLTEKWQAARIRRALLKNPSDVIISCSCDRIVRHIDDLDIFYWVHINLTGSSKHYGERQKIIQKWSKIYSGKRIIAVSQGIADDLVENIGLSGKNIRVIMNPIDNELINSLANEHSLATEEMPENYYVHVGRLEHRKRHDWLLDGFAKSGIESSLILLGDGGAEDFQRVRELISQHGLEGQVYVCGFLRNPYPIIKRAKALVLTSEREGLPTVLIESLMLGTPCISFDCPNGPREIMEGWLDEWLLPLGDTNSLASALQRFESSKPNVPDAVVNRFLPNKVAKEFERLLAG